MTRFKKGQEVISMVKGQGLEIGKTYTVTEVHEQFTPFGTFVTYVLDQRIAVANGHLLLKGA